MQQIEGKSRDVFVLPSTGERAQYSPDAFVARELLVNFYGHVVRELLLNNQSRIINFWGIEGSGKSWLLQHLAAITEQVAAEAVKKLSLTGRILDGEIPYQIVTLEVPQNTDEATIKLFEERIAQLISNKQTILFLDNADNCSPELWKKIEDDILVPLFAKYIHEKMSVVLILSSQKIMSRWRTPEMRSLAQNGTREVTPFTKQQQQELQQKRGSAEIVDNLITLSAGSPAIFSVLLDTYITGLAHEGLQEAQQNPNAEIMAYLAEVLSILMSDVLSNHLDHSFNTVAVLRRMKIEDFVNMCLLKSNGSIDIVSYQGKLRALEAKTNIFRFREQFYEVDTTVRRLREVVLQADYAEELVVEHQTALELYKKLILGFSSPQKEIVEYCYHLGRICSLKNFSAEWLTQQVKEILEQVKEKITYEEIGFIKLDLEIDEELSAVFAEAMHSTLGTYFNQLLDDKSQYQMSLL